MKRKNILVVICITLMAQLAVGAETSTSKIATDTVPGITEPELQELLSSELSTIIKPSSELAFSPDDIKFWAEKAKQIHASAPVLKGDPNDSYDVIIQIGHYPRKKGKTGGQGKHVNEQQISALVGTGVIQKLSVLKSKGKPLKSLLIGADDYNKGIKTKIFLSLHTDASLNPCTLSPSVGYQDTGDAKGMHGIALALAITLDLNSESFMRDNYTKNLSGYYAYSSINAEYFKGLLEMSELTCKKQEELLLERAAVLSSNLALAIQFALR